VELVQYVAKESFEDILHLLFKCSNAKEIWASLGLHEMIERAMHVDRSGSAVWEYLLRSQCNSLPRIDYIELKETVFVTCWYLWWIQRRKTHDEDVPPIYKCRTLILSITTNSARAGAKYQGSVWTWHQSST
jgi:hypothetical protein